MRRFLISEVISSFRDVLRLSKRLFSIRGDFGLDGPATSTSGPGEQGFSITTGETKPSLTFLSLPCWSFLLFWLLVVDILL